MRSSDDQVGTGRRRAASLAAFRPIVPRRHAHRL